jgi:hypothetical protein
MTTVRNGLLGGFVIGTLAAILARFVDTEPAPVVPLLDRFDGPEVTPRVSFFGQVLYGTLAGGLLLGLEVLVLGALGVPPTVGDAFGVAIGWAGILWGMTIAISTVGTVPCTRSQRHATLLYHVTYGLGLGVWIRLT